MRIGSRLPKRVAQGGRRRRTDRRGRRSSTGHGVCHDRRPADSDRALHGAGAHGDLCRARNLTPAQREHDVDDRDSDGGSARPCRSGRSSDGSRQRRRDTGVAGRRCSCPGRNSAPRLRGQLHLRAGAHGFKAGIGLVIMLDQIPKLLGINFHKGAFFHNVFWKSFRVSRTFRRQRSPWEW